MARKIKISVSGQTSSIYLMCSDCPSGQKPSWNGVSLVDFLSSSNLYSNTVEIEVDNNGVLLLPYGKTNNKFYSYTIEGDTKLSKDETLIINISSHAGSGTFRLETINITIDLALTEYLTNIANAIRAKKGTSDKINAQDFASEIENLPSGGEVIEVNELPIIPNDNTIYKTLGFKVFGMCMAINNEITFLTIEEIGLPVIITDILPDINEMSINTLYCIKSTGVVYINPGDGNVYNLADFFNASSGMNLTNKGYISYEQVEQNIIPDGDGIYVCAGNYEIIGFGSIQKERRLYEFEDQWIPIGKHAIAGLLDGGLTELVIPREVTDIRDYACAWMRNITKLVIPNGIQRIGDFAFGGVGETYLEIPHTVELIGEYAFGESSINTLIIKGSPDIKSSCFRYTELSNITIEGTLGDFPNDIFDKTPYYNDSNNWENNILYVSSHLIDVKSECSGDVFVKAGTKAIARFAFQKCTNITSIVVPEGVSNICSCAFENDSTPINRVLKKISLPSTVNDLKSCLFSGRTGIELTINNNTPPKVDSNTFLHRSSAYKGHPIAAIYVPPTVVETYKTAPG